MPDSHARTPRTTTVNPTNAFTVDVEDWYHGIELPFENWKAYPARLDVGMPRILGLLDRYRTKATFFILGWVANEYPELVKEIAERGHEIGSHGLSHEKAYNLSPEAFREEIRTSRKQLQDLTGQPVTVFRSPFFSVTSKNFWALEILAEEGFTIDCSISPVKTWRYGIEGCPDEIFHLSDVGITEFPVSTFRVLKKKWAIGGAYFRILPFLFTKKAFLKRQAERKCTMFYVHPWEFDPDHPVVSMEWKAKLTHYAGLRKTYKYTEKLLRHFKLGTVSSTVRQYLVDRTPRTLTTNLLAASEKSTAE